MSITGEVLLARLQASGFVLSGCTIPPGLDGALSGYVSLVVDRLGLLPPLGNVQASRLLARARWWGSNSEFVLHPGSESSEQQRICFPVLTPSGKFLNYCRDMRSMLIDIIEPVLNVSSVASIQCIGHVDVSLADLLQRDPINAVFDICDDTARVMGSVRVALAYHALPISGTKSATALSQSTRITDEILTALEKLPALTQSVEISSSATVRSESSAVPISTTTAPIPVESRVSFSDLPAPVEAKPVVVAAPVISTTSAVEAAPLQQSISTAPAFSAPIMSPSAVAKPTASAPVPVPVAPLVAPVAAPVIAPSVPQSVQNYTPVNELLARASRLQAQIEAATAIGSDISAPVVASTTVARPSTVSSSMAAKQPMMVGDTEIDLSVAVVTALRKHRAAERAQAAPLSALNQHPHDAFDARDSLELDASIDLGSFKVDDALLGEDDDEDDILHELLSQPDGRINVDVLRARRAAKAAVSAAAMTSTSTSESAPAAASADSTSTDSAAIATNQPATSHIAGAAIVTKLNARVLSIELLHHAATKVALQRHSEQLQQSSFSLLPGTEAAPAPSMAASVAASSDGKIQISWAAPCDLAKLPLPLSAIPPVERLQRQSAASQPVDGKLPLTAHQGSVSISLLEAAELATIKAEKETLERNYQMNHQHQAALHSSSAALSMIANAFSGNTKSTSSLQKQPVKQPAAAAASTVVDAKPVDSGALMSPSNAIKFAAELTDALHKAAHLSYTPSLSTSVPVTADSAWRSGEFALAVAVPVMLVKAPTAAAATAALSSVPSLPSLAPTASAAALTSKTSSARPAKPKAVDAVYELITQYACAHAPLASLWPDAMNRKSSGGPMRCSIPLIACSSASNVSTKSSALHAIAVANAAPVIVGTIELELSFESELAPSTSVAPTTSPTPLENTRAVEPTPVAISARSVASSDQSRASVSIQSAPVHAFGSTQLASRHRFLRLESYPAETIATQQLPMPTAAPVMQAAPISQSVQSAIPVIAAPSPLVPASIPVVVPATVPVSTTSTSTEIPHVVAVTTATAPIASLAASVSTSGVGAFLAQRRQQAAQQPKPQPVKPVAQKAVKPTLPTVPVYQCPSNEFTDIEIELLHLSIDESAFFQALPTLLPLVQSGDKFVPAPLRSVLSLKYPAAPHEPGRLLLPDVLEGFELHFRSDQNASTDSVAAALQKAEEKDAAVRAWNQFDHNGDGFLNRTELRNVMRKFTGRDFGENDLKILFAKLDANLDGKIERHEFLDAASGWLLPKAKEVKAAKKPQLNYEDPTLPLAPSVKHRCSVEFSKLQQVPVMFELWHRSGQSNDQFVALAKTDPAASKNYSKPGTEYLLKPQVLLDPETEVSLVHVSTNTVIGTLRARLTARPFFPGAEQIDLLTASQYEDIRQAWRVFDKNGDGSIDRKELRGVLKKISGKDLADAEVARIYSQLDTNFDGIIDWREFLVAVASWLRGTPIGGDLNTAAAPAVTATTLAQSLAQHAPKPASSMASPRTTAGASTAVAAAAVSAEANKPQPQALSGILIEHSVEVRVTGVQVDVSLLPSLAAAPASAPAPASNNVATPSAKPSATSAATPVQRRRFVCARYRFPTDAVDDYVFTEPQPLAAADVAKATHKLLTPKELEELRSAWKTFDQNGDGKINRLEVVKVLKRIAEQTHTEFSAQQVNDMFSQMDKNNDGTIEWLEFADSVAARWHPASQRLVSRAFESLFTHAFIADASRSAQHCFARHLSTGSSVDMDTATGIDFEILVSKEDSVGMATPLPPDSDKDLHSQYVRLATGTIPLSALLRSAAEPSVVLFFNAPLKSASVSAGAACGELSVSLRYSMGRAATQSAVPATPRAPNTSNPISLSPRGDQTYRTMFDEPIQLKERSSEALPMSLAVLAVTIHSCSSLQNAYRLATAVYPTAHAHNLLSATEIEEIRKAWRMFDINGDGRIERSEVGAAMQLLATSSGKNFDQTQANKMFDDMDVNHDGKIEWLEFAHAIAVQLHPNTVRSLASTAAETAPMQTVPSAWAHTAATLGVNSAVQMKLFADASPLSPSNAAAEQEILAKFDSINSTSKVKLETNHRRHDEDEGADPWLRRTCVVSRTFEPRYEYTENFVFECTGDFVDHLRSGSITFDVYHYPSSEARPVLLGTAHAPLAPLLRDKQSFPTIERATLTLTAPQRQPPQRTPSVLSSLQGGKVSQQENVKIVDVGQLRVSLTLLDANALPLTTKSATPVDQPVKQSKDSLMSSASTRALMGETKGSGVPVETVSDLRRSWEKVPSFLLLESQKKDEPVALHTSSSVSFSTETVPSFAANPSSNVSLISFAPPSLAVAVSAPAQSASVSTGPNLMDALASPTQQPAARPKVQAVLSPKLQAVPMQSSQIQKAQPVSAPTNVSAQPVTAQPQVVSNPVVEVVATPSAVVVSTVSQPSTTPEQVSTPSTAPMATAHVTPAAPSMAPAPVANTVIPTVSAQLAATPISLSDATHIALDAAAVNVRVESAMHLSLLAPSNAQSVVDLDSMVLPNTYVLFWIAACGVPSAQRHSSAIAPASVSPKYTLAEALMTLPLNALALHRSEWHKLNDVTTVIQVWHRSQVSAHNSSASVADVLMGTATIDLSPLASGLPKLVGWYNLIAPTHTVAGQVKICIEPTDELHRLLNPIRNVPPPALGSAPITSDYVVKTSTVASKAAPVRLSEESPFAAAVSNLPFIKSPESSEKKVTAASTASQTETAKLIEGTVSTGSTVAVVATAAKSKSDVPAKVVTDAKPSSSSSSSAPPVKPDEIVQPEKVVDKKEANAQQHLPASNTIQTEMPAAIKKTEASQSKVESSPAAETQPAVANALVVTSDNRASVQSAATPVIADKSAEPKTGTDSTDKDASKPVVKAEPVVVAKPEAVTQPAAVVEEEFDTAYEVATAAALVSTLPSLRVRMAELDVINARMHAWLHGKRPDDQAVAKSSEVAVAVVTPAHSVIQAPVVHETVVPVKPAVEVTKAADSQPAQVTLVQPTVAAPATAPAVTASQVPAVVSNVVQTVSVPTASTAAMPQVSTLSESRLTLTPSVVENVPAVVTTIPTVPAASHGLPAATQAPASTAPIIASQPIAPQPVPTAAPVVSESVAVLTAAAPAPALVPVSTLPATTARDQIPSSSPSSIAHPMEQQWLVGGTAVSSAPVESIAFRMDLMMTSQPKHVVSAHSEITAPRDGVSQRPRVLGVGVGAALSLEEARRLERIARIMRGAEK